MSTPLARRVSAVIAASFLGFAASSRASDREDDASLAALRTEISNAEKTLAAWARTEPAGSPLGRALVETLGCDASALAARPLLLMDDVTRAELEREASACAVFARTVRKRRAQVTGEKAELAIFDVSHIIAGEPPSFPAPDISLPASTPPPPKAGTKEPTPNITFEDERRAGCGSGLDADKLKELLDTGRARCREADDEMVPCEISCGRLIVRDTPEKLARVRSFLDFVASTRPDRLGIEVSAYRMSRELYAELASLRDGTALSPEGERLLERATREGLAKVVASERVLGEEGKKTHGLHLDGSHYLAGLEAGGEPSRGVVPTLGVLNVGAIVDVTATLSPDDRSATVDLRFSLAGRSAPSQKEKLQGYEVELPSHAVCKAFTSLAVPLGRGTLVGGFFATPDAGELASVVFLRVDRASARPWAPRPRVWSPPAGMPPVPPGLEDAARAEVARLDVLLERLDEVERARGYRIAIFDVHDILESPSDHPCGRLVPMNRPARGRAAPVGDVTCAPDEECPSVIEPDKLVELLKSSTGAEAAWGDPASADLHRGTVICYQTETVLRQMDAVLATLRKNLLPEVEVEASRYELDESFLSALEAFVAERGGTGGVLPEAALAKLDEAASRGEGARLASGGFLVLRPRLRSHVALFDRRAYVSDYDCPLKSTSVLPVIQAVTTGFTLDVRAEESLASGTQVLTAKISAARLAGMGRTETPHGPIHLPALETDENPLQHAFEPGTGLLVVKRAPDSRAGTAHALVLRARSLARSSPLASGETIEERLERVASSRGGGKAGRELERARALLGPASAVALALAAAFARYLRARRFLLAGAPRYVAERLRAGISPGEVVGEWASVARPLLRRPRSLLVVGALGLGATAQGGSGLGFGVALAALGGFLVLAALLARLGVVARRAVIVARSEALFPR